MPYVEASDHASLFVTHGFGEEVVDLGEIRMNYAAGRLTGTRSHPGGRPRTCPGARRPAAHVCRRITAPRHAASIASTM